MAAPNLPESQATSPQQVRITINEINPILSEIMSHFITGAELYRAAATIKLRMRPAEMDEKMIMIHQIANLNMLKEADKRIEIAIYKWLMYKKGKVSSNIQPPREPIEGEQKDD